MSLKHVKQPRNIAEFSLMKGVTDYTNMKQFDLFETSYGFFVVCSVPIFMDQLANRDPKLKACQDIFVGILEGEFKGIDGLPDITADAGTISNGVNELQLIHNVTMDTSIQVSMTYYERSGMPLTKYLRTYLESIKDPHSKAKTYGGLIKDGIITDPGPEYETFTFLFYVTDNTCRKLETSWILANAQPTSAPIGTMSNMQRGDITFPEVSMSFNCFPISNDRTNLIAAKMLEYQLSDSAPANKKLILDSTDYNWAVFDRAVDGENAVSLVKNDLNSVSNSTVENKYN